MQSYKILIFIAATLIGYQNKENNITQTTNTKIGMDTVAGFEESKEKTIYSTATIETLNTHKLVLTTNALQLVHRKTGSTIEIPFGKPIDQMIEITTTALQSKPSSIGIINECGAGLLKMASWINGLTLVF